VQKDKHWFRHNNGYRVVRSVQEKIDKHIFFRFEDAFHDQEEQK